MRARPMICAFGARALSIRPRLARFVALLALSGGACQDRNAGVAPPDRQLFFPSGMFVDDTATADGLAKYLFVANGNNDLSYNAGTLVGIDLERFWSQWYDPATEQPFPYCGVQGVGDDRGDRCIEPPGGPVSDEYPCRHLALKPQVIECDEAGFIDDDLIVHVGDFATVITASSESDADGDFRRLWLPVRGDPSITFIDVRASGDTISLDCDQGGEGADDPKHCGDAHRLRHLRNDSSLKELGREPFNMLIVDPAADDVPLSDERLAFVSHSSGSQLTLIDLDGVSGVPGPAIVDQVDLFIANGFPTGSFGFAQRPCFAAADEDAQSNIPSLTNDCSRPMVYASYREAPFLSSFTASGLDLPAGSSFVDPTTREDCFVDAPVACRGDDGVYDLATCTEDPQQCAGNPGACERVYAGQYCATDEQVGQACAVTCEPRIRADRQIRPGGLFPPQFGPILGDIQFADARGDALIVVQTDPGALLVVDTSLGADGEPVDQPASPPIEICAQPTRMVVHNDDGQRFALVSCFAAALVYVVDLEARRVVNTVVVGTGPHDLVIDEGRDVLYVANTLESSVSVVDLSRTRPTRFQELARIGLQEPFEQ